MSKKCLVFTLIISVIFFAACQKEYLPEDSIIPTPGSQGTFRAKIEGTQWQANSIKSASLQYGVILLYGTSTDKKSIILRVADSGVHNYTFNTESISNFGSFLDSAILPVTSFATNQWEVSGNYGNLNITSIDTVKKTISGSFTMKVYRQLDSLQRTITEGVFTDISYSTQPPPISGTDSFRVKVNGVNFTYDQLVGVNVSLINSIAITASLGVAPTVGLTVPSDVTPGTYMYDILTYSGQYNPSSSVFLGADTGRITILEHNTATKRIRGNFNFLANAAFTHLPPNVQLTEGYFSVKYQ